VEQGRYGVFERTRPGGHAREHEGLVWADCPDSLVAVGLDAALEARARVYRGRRPPVSDHPSIVVLYVEAEDEVEPGVKRVKEAAPDTRVVVLGLRAELALARAALRAGTQGYVHAGMAPEQVARALSVAEKGEIVLPRDLLADLVTGEGDVAPGLAELTPRQEEILVLVSEGLSNAEIAKRLWLSESTVKQHLRRTYKVLGVKGRAQAARLFESPRDP